MFMKLVLASLMFVAIGLTTAMPALAYCAPDTSGLDSTRRTVTCGYVGIPPTGHYDIGHYSQYNKYNINWSDSYSQQWETSGLGECDNGILTDYHDCAPQFFQPYYTYGDADGAFNVVVVDRSIYTASECHDDVTVTKSVRHTCNLGPIGGCLGSPYPDGSCSAGFVNNSGTCDRSFDFQSRCLDPSGYVPCSCPDGTSTSPIIVDVDNTGFNLTSSEDGVDFDIYSEGTAQHISWTASGSTNAFLALDRNGNGLIDKGNELFGNVTPQPISLHPNGFLALAQYDLIENGGNSDGVIAARDRVFGLLRLWQDVNHNGISDRDEVHTLAELGVTGFALDYKLSRRTDDYGNQFRYRAKVFGANGSNQWAWDVFLVVQQ